MPGLKLPIPDSEAKELAEFLSYTLELAGKAIQPYFRNSNPRQKPDGSLITDADRAAEDVLVRQLSQMFPHDAIISEEGGGCAGPSDGVTWYVDPLDGTSAFVEGLAMWGPTVARAQNGQFNAGALYLPRVHETWFAAKGCGAWRDSLRFSKSHRPMTTESVLYIPSRIDRRFVNWSGRVRSLGSTAVHLAQAAAEEGAIAIVGHWELWDIGCGILLVEESGGQALNIDGRPFLPFEQSHQVFFAGGTGLDTLLSSAG